ncbi:hypothetical protein J7I44_00570 [Frateuria sp. MAH-13]|uniref:DUF4426 domain-containing protein n=1 Tax=Frateuria flava TaxID=2821489 RepID=A0ABS4DIA8_9GAMM|nr:hypothetical protein [Frateuria flava]MBP1472779.1 hypothetical protein [Frateuria flava]
MAQTRDDGLQIEQDRTHSRREWRIERVGWAVMAILLAAGLLGLLGYGPLSQANAGEPGKLTLAYDRLQRASAPSEYHFTVAPSLARDGVFRLRFDNALLDEVELQSIIPEPEHVRAGPGYTEYVFAMEAAEGSPARIQFQFEQATFGHVRGNVTADGAAPLVIDQFILP